MEVWKVPRWRKDVPRGLLVRVRRVRPKHAIHPIMTYIKNIILPILKSHSDGKDIPSV